MYVLTFVTKLGDPDTVVMGVTMLTTPMSQSTSSGSNLVLCSLFHRLLPKLLLSFCHILSEFRFELPCSDEGCSHSLYIYIRLGPQPKFACDDMRLHNTKLHVTSPGLFRLIPFRLISFCLTKLPPVPFCLKFR